MLQQIGRLPENFDIIGTQIDFLIFKGQELLRTEAKNIIKFHHAFGFDSEEEAKQKLENTNFNDTDWAAFGIEVLRQTYNAEASTLKRHRNYWDKFYKNIKKDANADRLITE